MMRIQNAQADASTAVRQPVPSARTAGSPSAPAVPGVAGGWALQREARDAQRRSAQDRDAQRRGRIAAVTVLPAADILGLAVAVAVTGSAGLLAALYVLGVLGVLACTGQHRLRICLRSGDQAGRVLVAVAGPALLLPWLSAGVPAGLSAGVPAGQAARLAVASAVLVLACRALACAAVRSARRRGLLTETTLVVGGGTLGAHLAELMRAHPELGLAPQGFVDDGPPRRDLSLPWLGSLDQLAEVVTRLHIRRVVISFASGTDEDLVALVRACRPMRASVCLVPRLYELGAAVPRACLDEIWGIPLLPLRRSGQSPASRALKRAIDIVAAAVLLVVTAPVLLVLAAAIALQSGRSPLFRQVRLTGNGREMTILKLRTLSGRPDSDTCWTVQPQQCGRLGRLLRATHLDELPQLVNVLRGDMSLVGPRPERPYFAERFSREVPRYPDRHRMPAGLTGWAQVHGLHGDTSISERCRFDNQYIENWSPWLDAVILARTVAAALGGRTAGTR